MFKGTEDQHKNVICREQWHEGQAKARQAYLRSTFHTQRQLKVLYKGITEFVELCAAPRQPSEPHCAHTCAVIYD